MSNLSIHPMPNAVSPSPASRAERAESDTPDRHDPALAFNQVMQRHGRHDAAPRTDLAERARTVEPAQPPQRTAPTDETQPNVAAKKNNPAGAARPIARSERGAPINDAAGAASQAVEIPLAATTGPMAFEPGETDVPNTATGDLFAELGLALAAAEKMAAPSDPAKVATPAAGDEPAPDGAAVAARPVAITLALAPNAQPVAAPALRTAALDDRADPPWPTRHGARAPRVSDPATSGAAPSTVVDKSAQPLLPITAQPNDRTAAESDLSSFAAALDVRGGPVARSEPALATPLSLSAALSGGSSPSLNPAAAGTTYSIAHAPLGTAVGAPGFNDEFSQRVVMFAGQRVQSAEIALTPAELGPISVTMELRGQEASLVFGAAQSATRSAIEDALPRLREMFQAQGLHLVDAHVGAQLGHSGRRDGDTSRGEARAALAARTGSIGETRTDSTASAAMLPGRSHHLVDVRV